ncbi:MAG: WGR domain-containing protein [Deltaproteobacteria bacterium]|nr:WGR domain-containing protein [Deltaproteobacteria bacterium]
MGTWAVPYSSLASARRLEKLMMRPWIARVTRDEEGYPQWTCRDVGSLIGSDAFFDVLDSKAQDGKSFDIRPLVRRYLRRELSSLEESLERPAPLPVLNTLRSAVGLRPLALAPRYRGARRVAKRILELLSAHGFEWTQTYLVPPRSQRPPAVRGVSSTEEKTRQLRKTTPTSAKRGRLREYRVLLNRKYDLRQVKKAVHDLPLKGVGRNFCWVHFRFSESVASRIELDAERRSFDLEFISGESDKVWSAKQRGRHLFVSYGRRGTTLRTMKKSFASTEAAVAALHSIVEEKRRKGYADK